MNSYQLSYNNSISTVPISSACGRSCTHRHHSRRGTTRNDQRADGHIHPHQDPQGIHIPQDPRSTHICCSSRSRKNLTFCISPFVVDNVNIIKGIFQPQNSRNFTKHTQGSHLISCICHSDVKKRICGSNYYTTTVQIALFRIFF